MAATGVVPEDSALVPRRDMDVEIVLADIDAGNYGFLLHFPWLLSLLINSSLAPAHPSKDARDNREEPNTLFHGSLSREHSTVQLLPVGTAVAVPELSSRANTGQQCSHIAADDDHNILLHFSTQFTGLTPVNTSLISFP